MINIKADISKSAIKISAALCFVVLMLCIFTFRIKDMKLARLDVHTYNDGWNVLRMDGSRKKVTLPYIEKVPKNTPFIIEKRVSELDYGKTIMFLSADVKVKVYADNALIYSFGYDDKRWFGKTPGNIMNFVDIPHNMSQGFIRIILESPYDDYAGDIKDISIGEKDVCVLNFIKKNLIRLVECVFILLSSVILFILYFIQRISGQSTHSAQYMSMFVFASGVYYLIETKVLGVFYGNQTLYSILVFLYMMMAPMLLTAYYRDTLFKNLRRLVNIWQGIFLLNCAVQITLQLTGVCDFMEMAFVSHFLIMVNIIAILYRYVVVLRKKKTKIDTYSAMAIFIFLVCGSLDILSNTVGKTGDMGAFSRLGALIFALEMCLAHIYYLIENYTDSIKKTADSLRREKEAAVRANAAKSSFLANMSHEIRTPINVVLGMDEIIIRETKEESTLESAVNIQNAGKTLLSLINDILDFSKIESGKFEIVPVNYQLSSMLNDIVNMINSRAAEKDLEFKIQVNEEIPSGLIGDEVRVRQIITNILTNAVKYTDEGYVLFDVDYEKRGFDILLKISVTDTGRGIREEDIDKLFNSFQRVDEKNNCNIEGTGLGLSITKNLVSLMNGKITVKSEYGRGSTFTVVIPQEVSEKEPVGDFYKRYKDSIHQETSHQSRLYAPKARILLVDDNEMNLKVVTGLLKYTDINIDMAGSGREALKKVFTDRYDLILLDHMMPEMDGIETLKVMKENGYIKDTPVIALTANAISGARDMYIKHGFSDYLSKPITGAVLEDKILKWLPSELISERRAEKIQETVPAKQNEISDNIIEEKKVYKGDDMQNNDISDVNPDKKESILSPDEIYAKLGSMAEVDLAAAEQYSFDGMDGVLANYAIYKDAIDEIRDKLIKAYEDKDYKNYEIVVHSIKSNLAMIGVNDISAMAKELEMASKASEIDVVEAKHPEFIKVWDAFNAVIKEIDFPEEFVSL